MDATHDAPPAAAGRRQLTTRELATIRAALRLWIETPGDFISDRCHEEAAGVPLEDAAIEQLLVELALAGDVVITTLNPEAIDRRRI